MSWLPSHREGRIPPAAIGVGMPFLHYLQLVTISIYLLPIFRVLTSRVTIGALESKFNSYCAHPQLQVV